MIPATDLEYWASLGNLEQVKMALAKNPDLNIQGQDGYTGLHASAENGHLSVLSYLIEQGANVNSQLVFGHTPLDLAELAGENEAATLLRRHGGTHGNQGE